jgi:hypothetical protein
MPSNTNAENTNAENTATVVVTWGEPRIASTFRKDVLRKLVGDALNRVRIVGSDATDAEVTAMGEGLPVLRADIPASKLVGHVKPYLVKNGYRVTLTAGRSDVDDCVIGYTLHAVKSEDAANGRFRK